jgi:type II secretory pathway pseudopilin PulG
MGQQQLLLVILVTIIVGIATVVAINTFGAAADSANIDAVRQDVAQIAAAAQGYYMKPEMLGGGGRSFADITFNDIAFAASGISNDGTTAINENGIYVLGEGDNESFEITAYAASGDNYSADVESPAGDVVGTAEVRPNEADPVDFGGTATANE